MSLNEAIQIIKVQKKKKKVFKYTKKHNLLQGKQGGIFQNKSFCKEQLTGYDDNF